MNKKQIENTFGSPDFNFPKDVNKNARRELDKALETGDEGRAVLALLEICSAETIVQAESSDNCISLIDSVATHLTGNWLALARMIEASLVKAVYEEDRWTYNARILSSGDVPSKMTLWDESMFRNRTRALISESLAAASPAVSLKKFKSVITPKPDADYLLTDFLYRKAIILMNSFTSASSDSDIIPFRVIGSNPNSVGKGLDISFTDELLEKWHETLAPSSSVHRWAVYLETTGQCYNGYRKATYYQELWKEWEDNPLRPLLLRFIGNQYLAEQVKNSPLSSAELREFYKPGHIYRLLKDYQEGKYRISPEMSKLVTSSIENYLSMMSLPSVNFQFSTEVLPDSETEICMTVENLNSGYLLVIRLPESIDADQDYVRLKSISSKIKIVETIPFSSSSDIPFSDTIKITLPGLQSGRYCLAVSEDKSTDKLLCDHTPRENVSLRTFNVTTLTSFDVSAIGKRPEVFVVNAGTSAPLAGLNVRMSSGNDRIKFTQNVVTDSLGAFRIPDLPERLNSLIISSNDNGNRLYRNIWGIGPKSENTPDSSLQVKILIDRAIARPGDEVEFAAIAFRNIKNRLQIASEKRIAFELLNASNVTVDTLQLKTDKFGRCSGKLRIPVEGMLGTWYVWAKEEDSGESISYSPIRVEEYKNPTVRLLLDKPIIEQDSLLTIKGRVETFSGMAVPDSKVNLQIETWSPWWSRKMVTGTFSTETVTGTDGTFRVELSLREIKETDYEDSSYLLKGTATTRGGDVAQDNTEFAISKNMILLPDIPDRIEVTQETVKFNIRVLNQVGEPEKARVRYKLFKEGKAEETIEGEFTSPLLEIKSDLLPSGVWRAEFSLYEESEETGTAESVFTIWRKNDIEVPGKNVLWVPEKQIIASADADEVSVRFGSHFEGQKILCIISDTTSELSRRWIKSEGLMTSVSVKAPSDHERIFITLSTVRNFDPESVTVTVLPASENYRLNVKTETFRDKLVSGTSETWRFKFTYGTDSDAFEIASMAVMTDEALDNLVPFKWTFSPRAGLYWEPAIRVNMANVYNAYIHFSGKSRSFSITGLLTGFPENWIYGPYMNHYVVKDYMIRGSKRMYKEAAVEFSATSAPLAMNAAVRADSKDMELEEESIVEGQAYGADTGTIDTKSEEYRESECPVAFFLPSLTTEENGDLNIEFDVPNFNTSWKFQLLGYDKALDTAEVALEAVSTKPVMVSGSLPRFVRTGDHIVLTARAFNNTDNPLALGGMMEIRVPGSDNRLASREFKPEVIAPGESRLLCLEWDVPYNLDSVVILIKGEGDGHTDGERSLLQVLPSSSPVIESTDFYLHPGEKLFETEIPKLRKDSSVTLLYCDNPTWYCLTALPAMIEEEGKTLTSLIYNFYGNSIGSGLIKTRQDLREGLRLIAEEQAKGQTDILTSNLERNQPLKTVQLCSTPWVNSSKAETERMSVLINLLDSTRNKRILGKLLDDISNLQSEDGGIKWYPGSEESSLWCTGQMLLHFGMLNRFGYLHDDEKILSLTKGGFNYCRKQILKEWEQRVKENGDTEETLRSYLRVMTNFLYVTSLFEDSELVPKTEGKFERLAERSVKLLRSEWGTLGIYERATAATLLASRGYKEEAEVILTSLSQLAMISPRKGMWYDNLEGGAFSPWNKLITTAQVLEAFSYISPEADEIQSLRQWLILQRQSEDWGAMADAAELVQSVLGSCKKTQKITTAKFRISANGETLLESKDIPTFGELTISLDPSIVSGKKLKIERDGGEIAWGAVTEQYVAPISEIHSAAIDDLSIEKTISVLRVENGREKILSLSEAGELRIGDKVQILMTVKCGRDLEYVTLTDERGACLEPLESLSGVEIVDGRFLYMETRNSETRFFISYLPKGSYQFSYDCTLTNEGTFTSGIATVQSLYAPQLTAHSSAVSLEVTRH